jgi:hypothetical protein
MAMFDSHGFRKKISIQNANIDSNQTSFPVYVDITNDADFHEARADGYDIRFTQSDGETLLKYERAYWTGGGGSAATGHFWVKTNITSASATDIYCYYGDADASDGNDPTNVWTSHVAVWHMKDITTSAIDDSTTTNDGTKKGANEPVEAAGQIWKGQDFDGSDDNIACGTDASLDLDEFSITAWINPDDFDAVAGIYDSKSEDTQGAYFRVDTDATLSLLKAGVDVVGNSSGTVNDTAWNHVGVTHTSGGAYIFYIAGAASGSGTNDLTPFVHGTHMIGSSRASVEPFDGKIDEVRISSSILTADWIKFEYHNMYEADNELTWGSEEASGPTYTITCTAGSYAITGATLAPKHNKKIATTAGSYAVTGATLAPVHNKKIACAAGVYAITGAAATFRYSGSAAIYGDGWHMFQLMSQN